MSKTTRIDTASAVLWASAFLLAALVIIQAGKLPGNQANAGVADSRGDFSVLTARSGRGPKDDPKELLYVIDSREQMLLVYEVEDARLKKLDLVAGGPLPALFMTAR